MRENTHSLAVKLNEMYLMVSCVIDSYFFQDSYSWAMRFEKDREIHICESEFQLFIFWISSILNFQNSLK